MKQKDWLKRKFQKDIDPQTLPSIIERLSGTIVRLLAKLRTVSPRHLTDKPEGEWSLLEHVGHLMDLEPIWSERTEDILTGKQMMREADIANVKTHNETHDYVYVGKILAGFKYKRLAYVEQLSGLTEADMEKTALHPRLKIPMKIIDLAYFAAEHDDHHLAKMTAIAKQLPPPAQHHDCNDHAHHDHVHHDHAHHSHAHHQHAHDEKPKDK